VSPGRHIFIETTAASFEKDRRCWSQNIFARATLFFSRRALLSIARGSGLPDCAFSYQKIPIWVIFLGPEIGKC
jgi:hypothetical protein